MKSGSLSRNARGAPRTKDIKIGGACRGMRGEPRSGCAHEKWELVEECAGSAAHKRYQDRGACRGMRGEPRSGCAHEKWELVESVSRNARGAQRTKDIKIGEAVSSKHDAPGVAPDLPTNLRILSSPR